MKSISVFLNNIKNNLPYFLLILIYFFLVNLEANKDTNKKNLIENKINIPDNKSSLDDSPLKIKIPIIPFKQ